MTNEQQEALTTSEMIYQTLKQDIIRGIYPSGEKIRLETIKERYNVSYSPLREALSRLAESQLLVSAGQRGFRVPAMSREDFLDITETRIKLECMAFEMAMTKGDIEWESRVVAAYHLLSQQEKLVYEKQDTSQEGVEKLDKVHADFHQALLSGSNSNTLLFFVGSLNTQFDRYRRNSPTFQFSQSVSATNHRWLKEMAIERRIPEALQLLEEHIRCAAEAIMK